MHDGIHTERAGIPAAVICTEPFVRTAAAMAEMWGAPDFPVIYTEHPIGSLDREGIRTRAAALADEVVSVITGIDAKEFRPRV